MSYRCRECGRGYPAPLHCVCGANNCMENTSREELTHLRARVAELERVNAALVEALEDSTEMLAGITDENEPIAGRQVLRNRAALALAKETK